MFSEKNVTFSKFNILIPKLGQSSTPLKKRHFFDRGPPTSCPHLTFGHFFPNTSSPLCHSPKWQTMAWSKKKILYIHQKPFQKSIQAHCISASVATEEQKQSCTKRAGKNLFESHHFFVCSPSSLWHFLSLSRETYSVNSLCWMDFHIFLPY